MEKANADFEANKKEFWVEGQRVEREELKNESVTSTKGKLKVLQSRYQRLGSFSVDDAFDDRKWIYSKVNECHRCSVEHDDPVLDREIELQERARCVRKLKNNEVQNPRRNSCRHWMQALHHAL